MKKLFSLFFMATMLCMVLVACGDDEPSKTPTPKINFDVLENEVIVTAVGTGEVQLFQDDKPITNPVSIMRIDKNFSITFTATAQEEGKQISDVATLVVEIPSRGLPISLNVSSDYEYESDLHYTFDINLNKDSSSIYIYNVKFRIGENMSPAMTLRVDAPVTVDESGKIYTYAGTGIVAYMLRNTTWQPMQDESYLVNDLVCTVNTDAKTFFISFNCHGGHFEQNGQLK